MSNMDFYKEVDNLYDLYKEVKSFSRCYTLEKKDNDLFDLVYSINGRKRKVMFNRDLEHIQVIFRRVIREHNNGECDIQPFYLRNPSVVIKDKNELKQRLDAYPVPTGFYSLQEVTTGHEYYELGHRVDGYWTIGFWERDRLDSVYCYDTESDACSILFDDLVRETDAWNEWMKKPLDERYPGGRNRRK